MKTSSRRTRSLLSAAIALAAMCSAHAARLEGPLVFHMSGDEAQESGYIGVRDGDALEVLALPLPDVAPPSFLWSQGALESLLEQPGLAHVTLPGIGEQGQVINARGECLTDDSLASSAAWLPCSAFFPGQAWEHADGGLKLVKGRGRLAFWPGFSSRGTFIVQKDERSLRVVTAVLRTVAGHSTSVAAQTGAKGR